MLDSCKRQPSAPVEKDKSFRYNEINIKVLSHEEAKRLQDEARVKYK